MSSNDSQSESGLRTQIHDNQCEVDGFQLVQARINRQHDGNSLTKSQTFNQSQDQPEQISPQKLSMHKSEVVVKPKKSKKQKKQISSSLSEPQEFSMSQTQTDDVVNQEQSLRKLTKSFNLLKELNNQSDEISKIGQHFQDEIHIYQKINALLSIALFFLLFAASFAYFQYISPEIYNMYELILTKVQG